MTTENEELLRRVRELEIKYRKIQFVGLLVLVAICVATIAGAANGEGTQKLVRTERLEIVDVKGNVVAECYRDSNKAATTWFRLYGDSKGKETSGIVLNSSENYSQFAVSASNDTKRTSYRANLVTFHFDDKSEGDAYVEFNQNGKFRKYPDTRAISSK